MLPEKRYAIICEMLYSYDEATNNTAAAEVIKAPHQWEKSSYFPFYANAAQLLIEAAESMDKKTTSAGTLAALKRVVKNGNKALYIYDNGLYKTTGTDGIERFTAITNHMIIRLLKDVPSAPHATRKIYPDKAINNLMDAAIREAAPEEMKLPDAKEVKQFISQEKAKGNTDKIAFPLIEGELYVNPNYFLDILQIFPNCTAYQPPTSRSPIYFKHEAGDAILLPVNH